MFGESFYDLSTTFILLLMSWIVCQIGAREHYAVPRALHRRGELSLLVTDFWVSEGSPLGRVPSLRRLKGRRHPDLSGASVEAPNARMLAFELEHRIRKTRGWKRTISRNDVFQRHALRFLEKVEIAAAGLNRVPTLFSYSYAALEVFRFARSRGWRTVLGQIDPGPEEERIVAGECARYPELPSRWRPAPQSYWEGWREEVKLADKIVVNSRWSHDCLVKEGIPHSKIEIIPLVYSAPSDCGLAGEQTRSPNFRVLFLGQVNLRKGVARLLDAMRLLRDEPIELVMAGPSELEPSAWADLPKVNWIGPIPRSEVGRHYREADLFILPTLSDGYALTQLEALAHGLPVLASAHCGEAVSEGTNGSILGSLEPEGIAAALRSLRGASYEKISAPSFGLDDLGSALINLD